MTKNSRPSILFLTYSHNTWGGIEIWLDGLAGDLERSGTIAAPLTTISNEELAAVDRELADRGEAR